MRWEGKLSPRVDDRTVLVPNQPFTLGSAPSNTIRWVEGDVFKNQFGKFLPSVGFAWDPFKTGKTSIRANYRLATDRFATFLFGSFIFQGTPGNNTSVANSTFGQGGGLFRNIGPVIAGLVPSATPDALRQPPAFSTNSINAIDPDLQTPQIHEWSFSIQREVWNNVFEANYIGKHAVHLLGGYNVNQVNIFATVPGVTETDFLDAFNRVRASTSYNSPLINRIMSGNAANNAGTTRFRALELNCPKSGTGSDSCTGGVAKDLSSRRSRCGNLHDGAVRLDGFWIIHGFPFLFQPFPQFTGGFNVFDSNDYSNYHGLQLIFRRRITGGLGFQVSYTLSESKDNRSWDPSLSGVTTGSVQSASSTPFDLRDRNLNYAWSDFDRRHVFQGTYTYELPFGNGKRFGSGSSGVVEHVIGGWQFSGTILRMSGRPFTVYSGLNTLSNVVQSTADCSGCDRNLGSLVLETGRNFWFDASDRAKFTQPVPGSIGNTGRNFFLAPHYFQWDASLLKKIKISETVSFDIRVDARNVLNNPAFDNPTALFTSNIFGRINDSVTNGARRIQLSGKLNF